MRPQTVLLIEVLVGEEASKRRARLEGSASPKGLPLRIMTGGVVPPAVASALGWAWCCLEEATLAMCQIRCWREARSSLNGHEINAPQPR